MVTYSLALEKPHKERIAFSFGDKNRIGYSLALQKVTPQKSHRHLKWFFTMASLLAVSLFCYSTFF